MLNSIEVIRAEETAPVKIASVVIEASPDTRQVISTVMLENAPVLTDEHGCKAKHELRRFTARALNTRQAAREMGRAFSLAFPSIPCRIVNA